MQVRCPHCRNELDVDDGPLPESVDCDVCGSTFATEPDATVDFVPDDVTRFAHFDLLSKVGVGAHGTVWKARDTRLDRIVAVKIPRNDRMCPEDVERFLLEAQAAAQLRHPGIVSVHDTGRVDDTAYIATDFVDGSTLADRLLDRPMGSRSAAEFCAQLADALHHAHEAGIVHRDLKPSNIMLDTHDHAFLMDFGLAKRESVESTIAVDGSLLGTPAYMSPEQARGYAHRADRRSDIFSLGVILFQMLTGERPFRGSRQMILKQVVEADAPHPRRFNAGVPHDLDTICLKCLEKNPLRRYETASELADELRRHLRGEPIRARPITKTARFARWCQRKPMIASLSAALVISLAAGLIGVTTQWLRADANARHAMASAAEAVESEKVARDAQRETDQYLYVAHMNMAQQAYELADPQRVIDILDRHHPRYADGDDRRSFEWYYWRRQARRWSKTLRHTAPVNGVAVSSNGRTAATAGADGTIHLWDLVTGESRHTLDGHDGPLFDVAFSPTANTMLASTGRDRTLRFWDTSNGTEQSSVDLDRAAFCLEFSHDGETLLTGGADTNVTLWNVAPPTKHNTLEGHFDFVYSVAAARDGRIVASAGLDRTVRVWNMDSGELLHTFEGHALEVWSVAFSPDGSRLASGSADHTIRLWDLGSGREITTLDGHGDRIRSVAFSPDGKLLASASHDRTIRLWDMTAESKPLEVPRRDTDRRDDLFFERQQLPNADFPKDVFAGHAGQVSDLVWSANGKTLVSGGLDATARVWNVSELEERSTLNSHTKTVNAIAVSGDGRIMLSASNDRTARFWDLATMRQVGDPLEHDHLVLAAALSPDGRSYATGSMDGTVRLGLLSGSEPIVLSGHERGVSCVAFSPDSTVLATAGHDGTVRLWDVATGQPRSIDTDHDDRVQSVVFLANDRIASCGGDHQIRIWNVGSGETSQTLRGHTDSVWSIAVSPDGSRIASASVDKTVRLWDPADGRLIRTIDGHAEPVRSVAFCPDGLTLASGSDDKTIKLWDIETGEPKTTFKGHKYRVWSLAFTPDSERLLSGSLTIRVWHAPRGDHLMPGGVLNP